MKRNTVKRNACPGLGETFCRPGFTSSCKDMQDVATCSSSSAERHARWRGAVQEKKRNAGPRAIRAMQRDGARCMQRMDVGRNHQATNLKGRENLCMRRGFRVRSFAAAGMPLSMHVRGGHRLNKRQGMVGSRSSSAATRLGHLAASKARHGSQPSISILGLPNPPCDWLRREIMLFVAAAGTFCRGASLGAAQPPCL